MKKDQSTPTKTAVALLYDATQRNSAPRIVAKGRDELAERIEALAQAHGVPLYQDEALVAALAQIPLGEEIPQTLYVAVAEVLAFVYQLSDKVPLEYKDRPRLATSSNDLD